MATRNPLLMRAPGRRAFMAPRTANGADAE
jgi:hypothetical protein